LVATRYEVRQSLVRVAVTQSEFGRMTAITDGYGGDLDPSVSPSGDRIVFSSSRTGERHLWTARIDGSELRELTSVLGSTIVRHSLQTANKSSSTPIGADGEPSG
jgi:Tol biopolymer transport system component